MSRAAGEDTVALGLCREKNEGANLCAGSTAMKNERILIFYDILCNNIRLRSKRNEPSGGSHRGSLINDIS
jgi:hypothetical protein